MSDLVPFSSGAQMEELLTEQVERNTMAIQANSLALQAIKQLAVTKADRSEVRALEAEMAEMQAELQRVNHSRDYLTVVAFESLINISFEDRNAIGKELSKLSRRLAITPIQRPDDRFGVINAYHPFVCRIFCLEQNLPMAPLLKFAIDPR